MKKLILFLGVLLFSYQAKVEPIYEYNIKSSVSGEVVLSNKDLEAKNLTNKLIVKIDDYQEKVTLENLKISLEILDKEIKNQEKIVKRKENIYNKYKNLKTKSQTEKDLKFFDYINSYNQLLNLKREYQNTLSNIKKTQDLINKKHIKANGYLYQIYVNKGDFVNPGSLIAKVYDISKQKIEIYIPIDQIEKIKNKSVYINGKKSNFKINKIYMLPDSKYITSYKVELIGNGLRFGRIVNIELK